MKTLKTTFALLFAGIVFTFSACQKSELQVTESNSLTTTINLEVSIQVQNTTHWGQIDFKTYAHNNLHIHGVEYYEMPSDKIIYSAAGSSTLGVCDDTLHYRFPIKISQTEPVDLLFAMSTKGYNGSSGEMNQDVIFTYYPATSTMTSTIFSPSVNPFQNIAVSPNTSSTLDPNTQFSITCKPGTWRLAFKCD